MSMNSYSKHRYRKQNSYSKQICCGLLVLALAGQAGLVFSQKSTEESAEISTKNNTVDGAELSHEQTVTELKRILDELAAQNREIDQVRQQVQSLTKVIEGLNEQLVKRDELLKAMQSMSDK